VAIDDHSIWAQRHYEGDPDGIVAAVLLARLAANKDIATSRFVPPIVVPALLGAVVLAPIVYQAYF